MVASECRLLNYHNRLLDYELLTDVMKLRPAAGRLIGVRIEIPFTRLHKQPNLKSGGQWDRGQRVRIKKSRIKNKKHGTERNSATRNAVFQFFIF